MARLVIAAIWFILCSSSGAVLAAEVPPGFEFHKFNPPKQQPVTAGGVTTFHIDPLVCSNVDYGDGRHEFDCHNGNVRSNLHRAQDIAIGKTVEYKFDIRVDPSISYDGFHDASSATFYPGGIDSHLRIASWEGPALRNFIYMLKVSRRHGIDFLGRQCQAPEHFGEWVTFSLKTLWADDARGWVKVSCDDKVIYEDEGVATNQAPQCYPSNECEPWVPKNAKKFNFILGPVMMGFGPDFKKMGVSSMFSDIQASGITVLMRNIAVTLGARLYDDADRMAVTQLRAVLSKLGCDPGPEGSDGQPSAKTRQAAISCRKFPGDVMPAKLTVGTVKSFLSLYSSPQAASLPAGSLPDSPDKPLPANVVVHAAANGGEGTGADSRVISNIVGKVVGAKKGQDVLDFLLVGQFDFSQNGFSDLELILERDLDDSAKRKIEACGAATNLFERTGTRHAWFKLVRIEPDKFLAPANNQCIIAALSKGQAAEAAFLLDHFRDIAVGIVNDKTIDQVDQDAVKIFLHRVALGEVTVSRNLAAKDADARLKAEFTVHAVENGGSGSGKAAGVTSDIAGKIVGAKASESNLEFTLAGRFDFDQSDFLELEFVVQEELDATAQKKLGACGAPTSRFPDTGTVHADIRLLRLAPNKFAAPDNIGCIIAALPRSQAAQVAFLIDHFRDLAVGMVNDKTIDDVPREAVKIFMRRVASGDTTVSRQVN